jgi:hypothetical protein
MRFSIRDLLWVTLVVAMAFGWLADNQAKHSAVQQAHRFHQNLVLAKAWHIYAHHIGPRFVPLPTTQPDWSVLNESLVEP